MVDNFDYFAKYNIKTLSSPQTATLVKIFAMIICTSTIVNKTFATSLFF